MRPRLAVLAALLAVAAVAPAGAAQRPVSPPAADALDAVRVVLPKLGGGKLDLSTYRGKVVVLKLFSAGCPSCWGELVDFERVYREYRGRGVLLLGVAVQSPPAEVRDLAVRLGLTFPIALDESGATSVRTLGLRAMPTTVFLDRRGRVAAATGMLSEAALRERLRSLP